AGVEDGGHDERGQRGDRHEAQGRARGNGHRHASAREDQRRPDRIRQEPGRDDDEPARHDARSRAWSARSSSTPAAMPARIAAMSPVSYFQLWPSTATPAATTAAASAPRPRIAGTAIAMKVT